MTIAYGPRIVRDGLVLCLDAANYKSYPGTGTTWFDVSGFENDGTLAGSEPAFNSSFGGNFSFNGSGDYITTNFGANRNPYNNPITISVWVKPNTISGQQMFFSTHQSLGNSDASQRFYVGINNGYLSWGVFASLWSESGIVANTSWNLITVCIDNVSARFFLNTEQIYTKAVSDSFVFNYNIWFGTHDNALYFNGLMNLPMIYNGILSTEQMKQNFHAFRGRYGI